MAEATKPEVQAPTAVALLSTESLKENGKRIVLYVVIVASFARVRYHVTSQVRVNLFWNSGTTNC